MSEEIMSAGSLLTLNAELRAALAKAETERKAWTEIGAKAQADAAAMKGALEDLLHEVRHTLAGRSTRPDLVDAEQAAIEVWAKEHPGAQLLTELEAARRVIEAVRVYQQAVANLNGISAAEQALWMALHAYDVAEKGNAT